MAFTLSKGWGKSRTVWAGLVGMVFTVLSMLGLLPEALTSEMVVNTVMGVVSLAAVIFRFQADTVLTT